MDENAIKSFRCHPYYMRRYIALTRYNCNIILTFNIGFSTMPELMLLGQSCEPLEKLLGLLYEDFKWKYKMITFSHINSIINCTVGENTVQLVNEYCEYFFKYLGNFSCDYIVSGEYPEIIKWC